MRIRLIKPARVRLAAGTVVDTDPAQAGFLLSVGAAEAVKEEQEKPKKTRKSAEK